jgi:ribonuclease D
LGFVVISFAGGFLGAWRDSLLDAIDKGLRLPESELPKRRPREFNHPDVQMLRRFHNLKKKRDEAAAKHGIDPTLIAAKADLLELARDPGNSELHVLPWQLALLGIGDKTKH